MSETVSPDASNELDLPGPLSPIGAPPRRADSLPPRSDPGSIEIDCGLEPIRPTPRRRDLKRGTEPKTNPAKSKTTHYTESDRKSGLASTAIKTPKLSGEPAHGQALAKLFKEAEQAVQRLQTNKTRRELALIECLKTAALIHEHGTTQDPDGYYRLLSSHNIKITKRTANPYTPVVKLIFHALDKNERTTLSRYASILRYAHDHDIAPAHYSELLKEDGGIEGCANQDRKNHPSRERTAAAQKRANHFQALRASSTAEFTAIAEGLPGGLSAVLVDRDQKGNLRILGFREENYEKVQLYRALVALE